MTADAVAKILSGDQKLLEEQFNQHPQSAQLKKLLARNLFNKLFFPTKQPSRLDGRFSPAIEKLQDEFERLCVLDLNFFCVATHPLRKTFDALIKLGGTWYPRDAKASQFFYEKTLELIEAATEWSRTAQTVQLTQAAQIKSTDKSNNTKLIKTLADFIHWANAEIKRADLLEERLCSNELSQLNIIAAENYATELINSHFAQVHLPTDLSMRLNSHLKSCLQHAYLQATHAHQQENEGTSNPEDSPFLRKWRQLFPLLKNIFIAHHLKNADQELYRDIPIAINELELSVALAAGAQDTYTEFVSLLTHKLMLIVQHQPIDTFPFSPLIVSQEINFSQPNSFVKMNIDALKSGQWFLLQSQQNDWIRCKLALINSAATCLLFVDNTGRKVMLKSFADFSSLLALGEARPVIDISIEKYISDTLTQIFSKMASLPQDGVEQESRAIDPEKKMAAEKALAEAAKLATSFTQTPLTKVAPSDQVFEVPTPEVSSSIQETSAPPSQADQAEALEDNPYEVTTLPPSLSADECLQHIQSLGLGAWIEISQPNKSSQRLKLAVLIAAAGKYIFVDELGRKQGEFLRDQLLELMQGHHLKILSQGEKFEDQLVKVIKGLRKDIS